MKMLRIACVYPFALATSILSSALARIVDEFDIALAGAKYLTDSGRRWPWERRRG